MSTSSPKAKLVTSADCIAHYGEPGAANESKYMLLVYPTATMLQSIKALPAKIYCNRDIGSLLLEAFTNIAARGLGHEVRTWDGCYNVRNKKGSRSWSLHAWGLAVDINAAWNGFGKKPTMSKELVACFTDAGFAWGGDWSTPDGMHMQIAQLPASKAAAPQKPELVQDLPILHPPYPSTLSRALLSTMLVGYETSNVTLLAKVKDWQQAHGLVVDGIVGPKTWRALVGG